MASGTAPEEEARKTMRLTKQQIDYAYAFERRPFRPKTHPLFSDEIKRLLVEVARCAEEMRDRTMEYKELVIRQFVEMGYVDIEVVDPEEEDDGGDDD
uniref:Uncharacterized protein n=1 Tax=Oryza brachyantha TaxID=4533 RepID=J3N9K3_ORYBR